MVALEVRDRISGRMRADAVVVVTVDGHQYIVSMFGTISDLVRNLGHVSNFCWPIRCVLEPVNE